MSILSDSPTQPTVEFYQNEKANSIATIVTDKSSTQIQQDIETSFSSSVVKVGTSLLDELDSTLSDAQVMQAASKLDQALTSSISQVGDVTENVRAYSAIISSTDRSPGIAAIRDRGFITSRAVRRSSRPVRAMTTGRCRGAG